MTASIDVSAADVLRADLLGPRRDRVLTRPEVLEAGRILFGDDQALRLYGRSPDEWFEAGARILGRTCVEAALDPRAARIADAVAATVRVPAGATLDVADLFVGSSNLLLHVARALGAVGRGVEADPQVHAMTVAADAALGLGLGEILLGDWREGFEHPATDVGVVIVAPPWGAAFSFADGLDLGRTSPPVGEVLDEARRRSSADELYGVVQIPMREPTVPASIDALARPGETIRAFPGALVVGPLQR